MTARLLMIGLDGADAEQLDRGSLDGSFPEMAALRARGRAKRLAAPQGITDDALWASFQYGTGVGEHGRYFYLVPRADGLIDMAVHAEVERPIFWDALSDAGLRVAILDVPKCRAPRPLNGFHVADWLVHGQYFPEPRSYPEDLAEAVVTRFGAAPPSRCGYGQAGQEDADIGAFLRDLQRTMGSKRDAGVHYLEAEPWDLFVIGFKEAHCASHAFWDFEPDHPDHDAARAARLGHPVRAVLRDIDAAIGALVKAAGQDAEVVVFSTTEFQPNGAVDDLVPALVTRFNDALARRHWGVLAPLAQRVPKALPAMGRPAWRCEALPYNENCVALRVNRARRADYRPEADPPSADVLDFLSDELAALRDVDTGAAVISDVSRPSGELAGGRARDLPDLLAHCASGHFPRAVASPSLGRIEASAGDANLGDHRSGDHRAGDHRAGGFMIAAGAGADRLAPPVRTMADLAALAKAALLA